MLGHEHSMLPRITPLRMQQTTSTAFAPTHLGRDLPQHSPRIPAAASPMARQQGPYLSMQASINPVLAKSPTSVPQQPAILEKIPGLQAMKHPVPIESILGGMIAHPAPAGGVAVTNDGSSANAGIAISQMHPPLESTVLGGQSSHSTDRSFLSAKETQARLLADKLRAHGAFVEAAHMDLLADSLREKREKHS